MRKMIIALLVITVLLSNMSCGQPNKEDAKDDASNAGETTVVAETSINDETIMSNSKDVFEPFSADEINSFYKRQQIDLLYCELNPSNKYALACFKHKNGLIMTECVDIFKNRTMLSTSYWVPEQIEFIDDANFSLLGYFAVNGLAPPENAFPTKLSYRFDYSNDIVVPYEMPRYRAPLSKSYSFGKSVHAVISNIRLTATGLDLEFLPQLGYEEEFYAAYTHPPICLFSYDEGNGVGSVFIDSTIMGSDCDYYASNNPDSAVLWFKASEDGNNVLIEFELNELANYYYWEHNSKLNTDPIASLRFFQWSDD